MRHAVREEIPGVLAFVAVIWAAFLADVILPFDMLSLGLRPRTTDGLVGILAAPFLHGSLQHILSNTVPLFLLLVLLSGSRAGTARVVVAVALLGGLLLWAFGRPANHIGASGLIFGLAAFLILSGLLEGRPIPLLISIVVALLYGGTLLSGVLPTVGPGVSWDGHLCGAVAGVSVAIRLTRPKKRDPSAANSP